MDISEDRVFLDAFRGFAILSVICVHTQLATDYIQKYLNRTISADLSFFSWGRFGVSDFFLLSGFLIAMKNDTTSYSAGKYTLKRLVRIYPLWILFLVLQIVKMEAGFTSGWVGWSNSSNSTSWWLDSLPVITLLALTFCLWFSGSLWNSVIPGGWSIQSEVFNYILYPIIRLKTETLILFLMGVINCLTILVNLLLIRNENLQSALFGKIFLAYLRLNLTVSFGYFFLGVIAFRVITKKSASRKTWQDTRVISISNLIFVFFCISFVALPSVSGPQYQSIAFIFLSLVVVRLFIWIRPIREILIILGRHSYFLFYCHIQVLSATSMAATAKYPNMFSHDENFLFLELIIFTITTSIALGKISTTYIERPIAQYFLK